MGVMLPAASANGQSVVLAPGVVSLMPREYSSTPQGGVAHIASCTMVRYSQYMVVLERWRCTLSTEITPVSLTMVPLATASVSMSWAEVAVIICIIDRSSLGLNDRSRPGRDRSTAVGFESSRQPTRATHTP